MAIFGGEPLVFSTGLDLSGLDSGFKKGVRLADKAGVSMGNAFGIVAKGIAAVSGAAATLGGFALKTGAEFEALETRLGTLMHSAEAGKARMEEIFALASSTPFELDGLVEAEVNLRALGVDAEKALPMIMDFAGAMGTDLAGAAVEVGRAMQFGAGAVETISGRALRAQVELRTGQDALKMSTAQFREELVKTLTDPDGIFAGGTAKLATTFSGLMSNLQDQWTGFLKNVSDSGFFDGVKGALRETLALLDENKVAVAEFADDVGTGLTAAVMLGVQAVGFLVDGWTLLKGGVVGLQGVLLQVQMGFQTLELNFMRMVNAASKALGGEAVFVADLLVVWNKILDTQEEMSALDQEAGALADEMGKGAEMAERMNEAILEARNNGRALGDSAASFTPPTPPAPSGQGGGDPLAEETRALEAFSSILERVRAKSRTELEALAVEMDATLEDLSEATSARLEASAGDLEAQQQILTEYYSGVAEITQYYEDQRTAIEERAAAERAANAQRELDAKAAMLEQHFSMALSAFNDFVGARLAGEETLGQSVLKLAAGFAAQELLLLAAKLTAEGAALMATVAGIPAGLLKMAGAAAATAGAAALQAGATSGFTFASGTTSGTTGATSTSSSYSATYVPTEGADSAPATSSATARTAAPPTQVVVQYKHRIFDAQVQDSLSVDSALRRALDSATSTPGRR